MISSYNRFRPLSGIIYFNFNPAASNKLLYEVSVPSRGLSILILGGSGSFELDTDYSFRPLSGIIYFNFNF